MKYMVRATLGAVMAEELWITEAGVPVEFDSLEEAEALCRSIREDPIPNSFDLLEPWKLSGNYPPIIKLEVWKATPVKKG